MAPPEVFRCENKGNFKEKYEIVKYIDKGTYGEVNQIVDKWTKQIRTVKIMDKARCQTTDNFSDEIEILKKLDHPNIVRFYEFYSDDKSYYLVTEYDLNICQCDCRFCEGGNLFNALAKCKKMNEKMVALIMKQILSALQYCHKLRIVHRQSF
jgi:calcium-dependent protein kinase